MPDALPQCTLGHRTAALTAWLYYGLGVPPGQIVDVFNQHLQLALSAGGLVQMWHRLADVFGPWYAQIHRHCPDAGVRHAAETGWRVEGRTWRLWCFSRDGAPFYLLDPSRGHPALAQVFGAGFDGVLGSDFWAVYDAVGRSHQKCRPHLLRELKGVRAGPDGGDDWPEFGKPLRRPCGDALRPAAARGTLAADASGLRHAPPQGRMVDLAGADGANPHARRLTNRLLKYGADLRTFVESPEGPADKNQAEREIRPAVLMRKTSYGNQRSGGPRPGPS